MNVEDRFNMSMIVIFIPVYWSFLDYIMSLQLIYNCYIQLILLTYLKNISQKIITMIFYCKVLSKTRILGKTASQIFLDFQQKNL